MVATLAQLRFIANSALHKGSGLIEVHWTVKRFQHSAVKIKSKRDAENQLYSHPIN